MIDPWYDFEPLLKLDSQEKGSFLSEKGDRIYHCYLLVEGVGRVFYRKEVQEYNKTFFVRATFPTVITALWTNSPSELYFQALKGIKYVPFSYLKFKELFNKHRSLETLLLKIREKIWVNKEKHDIHMVVNDATKNYEIFRAEFRNLEQQIPLYHIASYLGITPIRISGIRSQMTENNI